MTLLLIQMAVILLVTVACGWLSRKVGQSRVIGEIVGGILIGPSVFGRFAPASEAALFPKASLGSLETLSTVGLILFLFLVGLELDYKQLYRQRKTAVFASGMSILLPFIMGAVLAHSLRIRFAPHGIGHIPFVLFLGIAMSITAFPVLARILEERNLQSTALGTTAILCAAVDDVLAWSLLAIALAMIGAGGGPSSLPMRLAGLVVYVVLMVGVLKPLGALGGPSAEEHGAFARTAWSRGRVYLVFGCCDRSHRSSPAVRRVSLRGMFPARGGMDGGVARPSGHDRFGFAASLVFRAHRIAHPPRPAQ